MENLISWFEIPSKDFARAVSFYKFILDVEIAEREIFGTMMGFFPSDDKNVSGAVVYGSDYTPSMNGVVAYLNGGNDLQVLLDRVVSKKGKIIVPKTEIGPGMGFFGMFIDTEGNKLGVHSIH